MPQQRDELNAKAALQGTRTIPNQCKAQTGYSFDMDIQNIRGVSLNFTRLSFDVLQASVTEGGGDLSKTSDLYLMDTLGSLLKKRIGHS